MNPSEKWDEYQHQTIRTRITTSNFDVTQGDTDNVDEGSTSEGEITIEPVGGLARDEVAELVALRYNVYMGHRDLMAGLADEKMLPTTFRINYELNTNPKATTFSDGGYLEEFDLADDSWSSTQHSKDDDAPGVLLSLSGNAHSPFYATDMGTESDNISASGDSVMYSGLVKFRGDLGGGPVFDRHDLIYEHHNHKQSAMSPDDGHAYPSATVGNLHFVWDVHTE